MTEEYVNHMEVDLLHNNEIILTKGCALKTTQGSTPPAIVGSELDCDIIVGWTTISHFLYITEFSSSAV